MRTPANPLGSNRELKVKLGFSETVKFPPEGKREVYVHVDLRPLGFDLQCSIPVWIRPQFADSRRRRHRVLTRCPLCGEVLSAGRLHQHLGKHRRARLAQHIHDTEGVLASGGEDA